VWLAWRFLEFREFHEPGKKSSRSTGLRAMRLCCKSIDASKKRFTIESFFCVQWFEAHRAINSKRSWLRWVSSLGALATCACFLFPNKEFLQLKGDSLFLNPIQRLS
jgi:hypothetical protein